MPVFSHFIHIENPGWHPGFSDLNHHCPVLVVPFHNPGHIVPCLLRDIGFRALPLLPRGVPVGATRTSVVCRGDNLMGGELLEQRGDISGRKPGVCSRVIQHIVSICHPCLLREGAGRAGHQLAQSGCARGGHQGCLETRF